MLNFFRRFFNGITLALLIVLFTFFFSALLFVMYLSQLILPVKKWRAKWHKFVRKIPYYWTTVVGYCMTKLISTEWHIEGLQDFDQNGHYLLISNHSSWLDILVITTIFRQKAPNFCFFMKRELKWQLPLIAQVCQMLDFPFMQRYSKAFLAKNPHLKGKDVESTRKACEKFKKIPVLMVNFVEGGRFSLEKHQQQQSPYKHLLKPKAGGVAFALATMGAYFESIINTTLVYEGTDLSLKGYFFGKIKKISVFIETIPINQVLIGDYENDSVYREKFQLWMNELWLKKDLQIDAVKEL